MKVTVNCGLGLRLLRLSLPEFCFMSVSVERVAERRFDTLAVVTQCTPRVSGEAHCFKARRLAQKACGGMWQRGVL